MRRTILKIFIVIVIFLIPQCHPLKKPVFYEIPETQYHIKVPVVRVGLIELPPNIEITFEKGMRIIIKQNDTLRKIDDVKVAKIELKNGGKREVYFVQLSAFLKKENAEKFIKQWSFTYKFPLEIFQSSHFYQVRIGPFKDRAEAMEMLKYSIENGIRDAWMATELVSSENRVNSIFLDDKEFPMGNDSDIHLIPSNQLELIKINGKPYRGIIEIKNNDSGVIIINILNIEDYLKGVVPLEMNPGQFNEIEALKAQAVSARTFVMRRILYSENKDYDICSTAKCQVYGGAFFEHPLSNKAVKETEGEIAVFNGEPINALYTGSCGGYTEDVENVFGGDSLPYLRGTFCFHSNVENDFSEEWSEEWEKEEIIKVLKRQFPIEDIIDIYPFRRGVSGKIVALRVLTSKFWIDLKGFNIKEIFKLPDLPEVVVKTMDQENRLEKLAFKGKGKGHGVGLCQQGAYIMAKMGKNYKEILLHYYKNIDILKWMGK